MTLRQMIAGGLISALLFASPAAWSATAVITAKVTKTLVDSVNFGGCMAALSVNAPSSVSCKTTWVTFSCTGDFSDIVLAYQKLDQAKLALTTNRSVSVTVDDSKKHSGYCFASRIDVL